MVFSFSFLFGVPNCKKTFIADVEVIGGLNFEGHLYLPEFFFQH